MMRAVGMQFARRGQQVAQRVVGVRVIHDHQEGLAQVDALEAAGHRRAVRGCPLRWLRAGMPRATPAAMAASKL